MALLIGSAGTAQAAYECSLVPQRVNAITSLLLPTSVRQALTVQCNRAPADPPSLNYRVTADRGLSGNGNTRRAQLGATGFTLNYVLTRATSVGGVADCSALSTNWTESGGSGNNITSTLNFGSATKASHTWEYCAATSATLLLPAGLYTDTVALTLRYPDTSSGLLLTQPLNLQFGVLTACLLDSPVPSMSIAYTSLQTAAATVSATVLLRCSTNTPWTVGLLGPSAPAAAPVAVLNNQSLLGLTYSLAVSPSAGTGQGNAGSGQSVNIQLTVPGGQSGTCSQGSCSASAVHTLVLSF